MNSSNYDGLGMGLGNLARLSTAQTRSISPENPSGQPGQGGQATEGTGAWYARELGPGWKISPSIVIGAKEKAILANIEGAGAIQHIWLTTVSPDAQWRNQILRMYWDQQQHPSVEAPLGDFFACGWDRHCQISSLPICVNPGRALNCFWPMPFGDGARIEIENRGDVEIILYYQISYTITDIAPDQGRFHARFHRVNPLPYKDIYTIVDGISGVGHYVGTYLAWGVNNCKWWGEGEIKFYIDDDSQFPTICGTGTEDYFCGACNFDIGASEPGHPHAYTEYTTPFAGMPQVLRPDGVYKSQQRFGMYRWHIMDPIRFARNLRVTIQALGWRTSDQRYLPLQDDIASVAFWYQKLPGTPFPPLPDRDYLEIN